MWSSSRPAVRSTSCLDGLAVPNTSAPRRRASRTAAIPTPPAAACTSTLSPGFTSATSRSPYQAVRYADGTEAASAKLHPAGTRAITRRSAVAEEPIEPGSRPNTRSPGARSVTPSPVSVTTPAPSIPSGTGSPG